MADNVAITAGSGTSIAADDVSSVFYQKVKIDVGGDGATSPLSASAPLPAILPRAAAAALSNVADTASSTTLQASNAARGALIILNDSTVALYVKYGATASATSFTYKLGPGETLREEQYTGIVDGIWASDASGSARVTELTVA